MNAKTNLLLKNISFIAGVALIFFSGLYFVLFTDLYFNSDSAKLFGGIIFAFGSGIAFVLAENCKNKKWLYILIKAIAIALAVGFVAYLFWYKSTPFYAGVTSKMKLFKMSTTNHVVFFLDKVKFNNALDISFNKEPWFVTLIILGIVSFVSELYNLVHQIIFGIEE